MYEHSDLVDSAFPTPGIPTDVSSLRTPNVSVRDTSGSPNPRMQPRLQDLTSPADSDMGGALKVPNPHTNDPWNKPNLRD